MKVRFYLLPAFALIACYAWAQPTGDGHALPPGSASVGVAPRDDVDPRRQRDELRSLIREQHRPDHAPDTAKAGEPHARQLSREEREALREQLRRQRAENWRRAP